MGWACWVCGGDQGQVQSAVSVGRARGKRNRGLQALSAIAFPGEGLKIFRFCSRGKVLLDKSGGWREKRGVGGGACTGRGRENKCMHLCVFVLCVFVLCVCCVCLCAPVHVCISVRISSSV